MKLKLIRKQRRQWLLILLLAATAGCSDLSRIATQFPQAPGATGLDGSTIVAGLREALQIGTTRTTEATGRVDGFLGNALIRIALPDSYQRIADAMRRVNLGSQVDELEVAMNRAAEKAAGEARTVFWDTIRAMTITDGLRILQGGDMAATEYFRGKTSATLQSRFQPIVQAKMQEVGLYRLHNDLANAYLSLPFSRKEHLVDLDQYVTDRALRGLFTVLGQEEQRIRQDPAARTTELLRRVFGSR